MCRINIVTRKATVPSVQTDKPIEIDSLPSTHTIITKIASTSSSTALSTSSAETESGQGEVVEYFEASIAEKP